MARKRKAGGGVKLESRLFRLREMVDKNTFISARSASARAIKAVVESRIQENLSGKAKPPFKPLSPAYKAWKKKHYGNLPILVLTGRSKRTCKVTTTNEGGSGSRSILKIKVTVPSYFWFHHTGTRRLPKRDWLALQPKDRREIKKIIENSKQSAVGKAQRKVLVGKRGRG